MDTYPRACTRSEYSSIRYKICPQCGRRYRPTWARATGTFEESVDPIGALVWDCPEELCDYSPE
ncbi:hypothetical protein Sliba_04980 [Streptomyces nigrescens]|uniref:Uncharacterized protein n=1 Tax=Streptomyces nigrescens TaxID=1920 RepID=A0A640TEH1_STRNI|nr:hypothetical protein Sliba_04980 [Streptomyces libani subsp. libani]GGV85658.1 hypothetical protein GCM10010500_02510 [Streptomyces libani subsp. libani]